jgi:hypothetical protein
MIAILARKKHVPSFITSFLSIVLLASPVLVLDPE